MWVCIGRACVRADHLCRLRFASALSTTRPAQGWTQWCLQARARGPRSTPCRAFEGSPRNARLAWRDQARRWGPSVGQGGERAREPRARSQAASLTVDAALPACELRPADPALFGGGCPGAARGSVTLDCAPLDGTDWRAGPGLLRALRPLGRRRARARANAAAAGGRRGWSRVSRASVDICPPPVSLPLPPPPPPTAPSIPPTMVLPAGVEIVGPSLASARPRRVGRARGSGRWPSVPLLARHG